MHGALRRTAELSCIVPNVAEIGSEASMTLNKIKQLVEMTLGY